MPMPPLEDPPPEDDPPPELEPPPPPDPPWDPWPEAICIRACLTASETAF